MCCQGLQWRSRINVTLCFATVHRLVASSLSTINSSTSSHIPTPCLYRCTRLVHANIDMTKSSLPLVLLALALSGPALAQYSSTTSSTAISCPITISAAVAAPSVAAGFEASLVANGLYKPRGIAFDGHGHLLVLEQTAGIVALDLSDAGRSCVTSPSRHVVVNDTSVSRVLIDRCLTS